MTYKGYTIDPDMTGYAPKNSKYFFAKLEEEKYCGSGESIEGCEQQIDELIEEEKP